MVLPQGRVEVIAGHVAMQQVGNILRPSSNSSAEEAPRAKVCLVLGAGAGIGVNVARRFAQSGMTVCICRRSNADGLQKAVDRIKAEGGVAYGFLLNAVQPGVIEDTVNKIEAEIGEIHVAVYNLGAQIGGRPLENTSLKTFEMGWRMGCEGLFRLAKVCAPHMLARGTGTILCTSATSSMRGNRGQHSHGASIDGHRMLLQSLNHELGPQGIHICHIVVDAAVDAPETLGKLLGKEAFEKMKEAKGDGILNPEKLAETYYHISTQHRSCWTFEIDVRPYDTVPWWNSQ